MVVVPPFSDPAEREDPMFTGCDGLPWVELRIDFVGRVDVRRWPERFFRLIHEIDRLSLENNKRLWSEPFVRINDLNGRCVFGGRSVNF